MVYKVLIGVFLVFSMGVVQIDGQFDCTPLPVQNVTLSYDLVLSWEPHPEEKCDIIYYMLYIDFGGTNEHVYVVARLSVSVDFLPVCTNYVFRVIPVSADNLIGDQTVLATKIPIPIDANLTVSFLKISQTEEDGSILLDWSVEEEWTKCADRFRVVIVDRDLDYPQDIYTYAHSLRVPSLAPCTWYEFGVVALYNWEIEGPITVLHYNVPPAEIPAPTLSNIAIGNNNVNMTWQLEPYPRNKCAVIQAHINVWNAVERFNLTLPVLDQTERQPVTIHLPNLSADNIYFVNTTLVNIAGPSPPVILVVQTRP